MEKPLLADKVRDLVVAYWRLGSTETETIFLFVLLKNWLLLAMLEQSPELEKLCHGGNTIEPGERLLIP